MPQELITLLDLLTRPEFLVGLGAAVVATVVFLFIPSEGVPGWGIALVASVMVGISITVGQRAFLMIGLTLLAVGGWMLDRPGTESEQRYNPAWAMIAVGALVVALRGGSSPLVWSWIAVPVLVIALGAAFSLWSMGPHRYLLGTLVAVTAFGIWATVPNTDLARVLMGACLPLAIATLGPIGATITRSGAYALSGLLVAIAADGGHDRPASIVGAWACVGILALLPAIVAVTRNKPVLSNLQVFLVHALLVLIASRVIGMWYNPLLAAAATATLWVAAGAILGNLRVFNPTSSQ